MTQGVWIKNATGHDLCLVTFSAIDSHFYGFSSNIYRISDTKSAKGIFISTPFWDYFGFWITVVTKADGGKVELQYWQVYHDEEIQFIACSDFDRPYGVTTIRGMGWNQVVENRSAFGFYVNGSKCTVRNFSGPFYDQASDIVNRSVKIYSDCATDPETPNSPTKPAERILVADILRVWEPFYSSNAQLKNSTGRDLSFTVWRGVGSKVTECQFNANVAWTGVGFTLRFDNEDSKLGETGLLQPFQAHSFQGYNFPIFVVVCSPSDTKKFISRKLNKGSYVVINTAE